MQKQIDDKKKLEEGKDAFLHDIGERVKELECMCTISTSARTRESIDEIFQDTVTAIPPGWHYPDITRGKLRYKEKEWVSEPFEETAWKQSSDIFVDGKNCGSVEVYYLEERPTLDEGPFMKEERNLIDGIARTLGETLQRRNAEGAFTEIAAKYRNLVDNSLVGVFTKTLDGRFTFANDAIAQMYEFDSPEQMLAEGFHTRWSDPAQRDEMLSILRKHGSVANFEAETITRTGQHIHVTFSARLQSDAITGMVMDLTERKNSERLLEASEARFRMISEYAPVMMDAFDSNGRCVLWNRECERVFGWTEEEILAHENPLALFYPDPEIQKQVLESVVTEPGNVFKEWHPRRKDGSELSCLWANFMLPDGSIISLGHDLTDRKRDEEMIVGLGNILEASLNEIFICDAQTFKFVQVNEGARRNIGYSMEELKELTLQEINPEFSTATFNELVEPLRKNRQQLLNFTTVHVRKDGSLYPVEIHLQLLRLEDRAVFVAMILDISERKQAEKQLQQYQQRLRALASELTMTEERERRRIATELHDGAAQSLAFARMQLASTCKAFAESEATKNLEDVSQVLRQSLEQIREVLLDLSSPSMNEIGLGVAISDCLEQQTGRRHGLRTSFVDECGKVPLDDDVRAVLFRNARELLANVVKHARADSVSVHIKSTGEALRITIEDDGAGMDPDETLPTTDGGGFGLFSIRERMLDLGGSLEIVSAPGEGCKATLVVPLNNGEEGS